MTRCGIYRIVHLLTGREYVGQARNIDQRWKGHLSRLKGGRHHARHLQYAWRKYGGVAFAFEVIELCDLASLDEREQYWIDTRKPVFNTAPIAGSPCGMVASAETRAKISQAGLGRKHSEETKAKIRAAHIGRKHSDETRAKMRGRIKSADEISRMRAKLIGRKLSPEHRAKVGRIGPKHSAATRAKLSLALKGRKFSDEHREKLRQAARKRDRRRLTGDALTRHRNRVLEIAAARTGCSSAEEWRARRAAGLKWCGGHRDWLPVDEFWADGKDKQCRHCRTGMRSKKRAKKQRERENADA